MKISSIHCLLALAPATIIAATLHRRDSVPSTQWTSAGCYVDSVYARVLSSAFATDGTSMTPLACTNFCTGGGHSIAGLEYGGECWCGGSLPQTADDPSACNMACSGDAHQICGGPNRLSVWTLTTVTASVKAGAVKARAASAAPSGWNYLGCYTDTVSARTLSRHPSISASTMTVEACAQACGGSTYFGVEYSQECFCGNSIQNGATSVSDGCVLACKGNSGEICGGSNRLSLFQASGSGDLGGKMS